MPTRTAAEPTGSKKQKGGPQEGSGRPRKDGGVRSEFYLSPRGRQILQLSKTHLGKKQLTPTLEEILEDYAVRYDLPVTEPKGGEDA